MNGFGFTLGLAIAGALAGLWNGSAAVFAAGVAIAVLAGYVLRLRAGL